MCSFLSGALLQRFFSPVSFAYARGLRAHHYHSTGSFTCQRGMYVHAPRLFRMRPTRAAALFFRESRRGIGSRDDAENPCLRGAAITAQQLSRSSSLFSLALSISLSFSFSFFLSLSLSLSLSRSLSIAPSFTCREYVARSFPFEETTADSRAH